MPFLCSDMNNSCQLKFTPNSLQKSDCFVRVGWHETFLLIFISIIFGGLNKNVSLKAKATVMVIRMRITHKSIGVIPGYRSLLEDILTKSVKQNKQTNKQKRLRQLHALIVEKEDRWNEHWNELFFQIVDTEKSCNVKHKILIFSFRFKRIESPRKAASNLAM